MPEQQGMKEFKFPAREVRTHNDTEYHNWTIAEGVLHLNQWLDSRDEQKLRDVIDWLTGRGYAYYEKVHWIATTEYVESYAKGEGRIVTLGIRKFFLPAAWIGRLEELIAHKQTYLTREQAEQIAAMIRQDCPSWEVDIQHASQRVESISPDWDEWRIESRGIYKGVREWTWSVNHVGEWEVMCQTMERERRALARREGHAHV